VRRETAGPEGARGLLAGEYQFAEFGAVPIVQAAIEGHDPLILMAAEPSSALYILALDNVRSPQELAGREIGVLSEQGQTGYSAKEMLARWKLGGDVALASLGTYPAIYRALAQGEIASGILTADYKVAGESAYGLRELADLGREFQFQGPVLATTRRLRDRDPGLVQSVVKAYVRAVRLFKSAPARVIPVLRDHLGFVSAEQAAEIQRFYAARFQDRPFASRAGIARVIESFAGKRPGQVKLTPDDVCDSSFMESALRELA
jgi:ABC-type nitrate/sulfonate/bicarbonate transport system substrate-binding protein